MATTKLTITIENEQLAVIRSLVASGHAASVSAFVKHAVKVSLHDAEGWKEMLASALQETGGPLTTKERAWADRVLTSEGRKRPPKGGQAA